MFESMDFKFEIDSSISSRINNNNDVMIIMVYLVLEQGDQINSRMFKVV